MCSHPCSVDPVLKETARVAKVAFPKGTTYITMRDALCAIFEDEDFAHLFPRRGQPAMARMCLPTLNSQILDVVAQLLRVVFNLSRSQPQARRKVLLGSVIPRKPLEVSLWTVIPQNL